MDVLDHGNKIGIRMDSREALIDELRAHALVIGRVTLTSGAQAEYYVDAKRAILRPRGFLALGDARRRARPRAGARRRSAG